MILVSVRSKNPDWWISIHSQAAFQRTTCRATNLLKRAVQLNLQLKKTKSCAGSKPKNWNASKRLKIWNEKPEKRKKLADSKSTPRFSSSDGFVAILFDSIWSDSNLTSNTWGSSEEWCQLLWADEERCCWYDWRLVWKRQASLS